MTAVAFMSAFIVSLGMRPRSLFVELKTAKIFIRKVMTMTNPPNVILDGRIVVKYPHGFPEGNLYWFAPFVKKLAYDY